MQAAIQASNLGFSVGSKNLIQQINLNLFLNEKTAILGPSGSGKSTLVKCLISLYHPTSGHITQESQDILKNKTEYRQSIGYVPQDDLVFRDLSVFQNLYYSAKLRLNAKLSEEAIEAKVKLIANILGLDQRLYHKVKKLSGGQRKRVNIGLELLADPKYLFLDEPASGLDPATEEDLLNFLTTIQEEKVVLLTTHSMEYLDKMERILIMMEGYLIYNGNLENMKHFFNITHPADLFKCIREYSANHWFLKFSQSKFEAISKNNLAKIK